MLARTPYDGCPLCGSVEVRSTLVADCSKHPLYHPLISPKISWLLCAACEHIYADGYHSEAALRIIFSKTNDNQKVGFEVEKQRAISARMIEKLLPYVDHGDWCDIGFGNGSLLMTAQEYGFNPVGIDLRTDNVETLKQLGIEAHSIDLGEFVQPGRFAVISMFDVLEHMPYPVESLKHVHSLLRDDGLLFLSMPNTDSMVWRIFDSLETNPYWGELEHYHNFGKRRLYRLLVENGFEPIRYGVSERYRFGMEVVARKSNAGA